MRFSFSKKALAWVKVGYVDPQLAQKIKEPILVECGSVKNLP
jgi:hypothetical protein